MNSQSAIGDSWRFAAFDATKKAVKAKDFEFVYILGFLLADVFTGLQRPTGFVQFGNRITKVQLKIKVQYGYKCSG